MLKVHIVSLPEGHSLDEFRAHLAPGIQVTTGQTLPDPADFHVLVAGRPSREQLAASPNLKALIIPFAGLPTPTRELLADFPQLSVHNLHHNLAPTAEMAIALLLAATRFLLPIDRRFRHHDWTLRYEPPPVVIMDGATALILGYGAIGQRVARICHALGMRILAVRRNPARPMPEAIPAEVYPLAALPDLLPRADALLITLPSTDDTRGLIGAQALSLLPAQAVLVNVGRGDVVDEEALYTALRDGRLRAAGLDVWYRYPPDQPSRTNTPPSRFPFHELDNVVMSPHRGGAFGSEHTERSRLLELARLLNTAASGEPMPNQVDLADGY